VNAFLSLLAERRRGGLAAFAVRLCESGLARAHDRGEAEPVRRGWARALLRWEDAWREGLRRRDGGCRGR
jgi:hypothetical protein